MIESFKDKKTKALLNDLVVRSYPTEIRRTAKRKLTYLNAAVTLNDLKVPPGNQLEKLTKDRKGQYSIRINSQWRICFVWKNDHAYNVEITDYH